MAEAPGSWRGSSEALRFSFSLFFLPLTRGWNFFFAYPGRMRRLFTNVYLNKSFASRAFHSEWVCSVCASPRGVGERRGLRTRLPLLFPSRIRNFTLTASQPWNIIRNRFSLSFDRVGEVQFRKGGLLRFSFVFRSRRGGGKSLSQSLNARSRGWPRLRELVIFFFKPNLLLQLFSAKRTYVLCYVFGK